MKNLLMFLLAYGITFAQCVTPIPKSFAKESGVLFAWANASNFWTRDGDGYARVTVQFLDGSDSQINSAWKRFSYIDSLAEGLIVTRVQKEGQVRVSFKGNGNWSYVGKNALLIRDKYTTLNIQLSRFEFSSEWDRVALHEFLHALGFEHEHQHPQSTIPWDKKAVYEYYGRTQGWSRTQINEQVLNRKSVANIFTNGVDKYSIMEYPVDNSLTIGDFEIGWNKKMTKMDIELLKKAYPNPK